MTNKKLAPKYHSPALRLLSPVPLPPERYWRIDDWRTDSVIIVKARTAGAAMNRFFLETCAENCLIAEASEADIENFGRDIEED